MADKTYFIADVHLTLGKDPKKMLVHTFLDRVIAEKADLYVLGDFFDYWANNKIILNDYAPVLTKLSALSESGAITAFLIGNRDFLITPGTLAHYGLKLLGEETTIHIKNQNILIAHGHTLCRSDIQFLQYRNRYWPIFRFLDKFLPGFIENYIAGKFMLKSKTVIESQDPGRFQITRPLLEHHFNSGIDAVICGHIHKYVNETIAGKPFYVLPAWENRKGNFLLLENGRFFFDYFTG